MSEWISVKDELPPKGGRYMVCEFTPHHLHNCLACNFPFPCCEPNIAYYRGYNNSWQWHTGSDTECKPTHWMTLPKPPEEYE